VDDCPCSGSCECRLSHTSIASRSAPFGESTR
jgi:hypothetical protein